jgi:hypothetical protein
VAAEQKIAWQRDFRRFIPAKSCGKPGEYAARFAILWRENLIAAA